MEKVADEIVDTNDLNLMEIKENEIITLSSSIESSEGDTAMLELQVKDTQEAPVSIIQSSEGDTAILELQVKDTQEAPVSIITDTIDDTDVQHIVTVDVHNFYSVPIQVTGAWEVFESLPNNYTRGCKWSPDGTCLMSCSNDNRLRLFNLPSELCENVFNWENVEEMHSVVDVSEGETIYDYCWYPLMSSNDPVTSCFVSTARGSPIHMWDAFTGELRCSYRPFNHLDEVVAATSLAFDCDGQKLYSGFNKKIRVFDVAIPGRTFSERATYEKKTGQFGIISCFAFSPESPKISAAGSYGKTIGIYSEPDGHLMDILVGHTGGVTHLKFSPDGTKLYSGARMDSEILCWDLRNLNSVLFSLRRVCDTNQRIYFDLSRYGKFLVSGNCNGIITVWDLTKTPMEVRDSSNPIIQPWKFFTAHNDCVNGISLHPTMPLLVSSSGQRKSPNITDSEDELDNNNLFTQKGIERENSLRLWWTATAY